ncbi:MAG: PIN domain-containing protein [Deltaproteobacteria bacterium]|nr:PIN domain-containing protein [Deltaproteobacteria bacterium]
MNGNKNFIDTNILVYGHDVDAGPKHQIAQSILMDLWKQRNGVISVQVLQEFYATMTRKILRPLPPKEIRNIIRNYFCWPVEISDPLSILNASRLEETYRISFWDALIITAASKAGVEKILTEGLQSGQIIEGIRIENPFLS